MYTLVCLPKKEAGLVEEFPELNYKRKTEPRQNKVAAKSISKRQMPKQEVCNSTLMHKINAIKCYGALHSIKCREACSNKQGNNRNVFISLNV